MLTATSTIYCASDVCLMRQLLSFDPKGFVTCLMETNFCVFPVCFSVVG